ncbi:type II toxin-antitoxin system Phd/YefM family antitoxin [Nocardia sp. NPDC058666]|uniref:type II toxin-antitoxin system Phd/YefM family antitoxin n=1 Tax=Nocardia sp. NPDC058666 TaxID=3346587 RepID=UPI003657332B
MDTIPVSEAEARLDELVDKADREHDHFILTHNGRERAILVGISEWESIQETMSVFANQRLREELTQTAADDAAGNLTTHEEMTAIMIQRLNPGSRLRDSGRLPT